MKKYLVFLSFVLSIMFMSLSPSHAQSDKELIKAANKDIKNKDYEPAFMKILNVSKPEQKKPQAILKETYPNVIAGNFTKANAVKISDKDNEKTKSEKLEKIIAILKDNCTVDSLFKKNAQPSLYKSLSKRKKVESTLATYNAKLKVINDARLKLERIKIVADSLRSDSIAKVMEAADSLKRAMAAHADSLAAKNASNSAGKVSTANAASGDKKYYIIAGSYKTQEDAQTAVNRLKTLGYASEIVGQNSYGNLRISYSGFNDKSDALKELEKIKGVQADAWLFEK